MMCEVIEVLWERGGAPEESDGPPAEAGGHPGLNQKA